MTTALNEKEYQKAYRDRNKERLREQSKEWREANKESLTIKKKLDYEKNKEAYKARAKASWESNLEKTKAIRSTPEYRAHVNAQRRAKYVPKGKPISISREERLKERREEYALSQAGKREAENDFWESQKEFIPDLNCWKIKIKGYSILVDSDFGSDLNARNWECRVSSSKPYFRCVSREGGKSTTVWLHRIAMICPRGLQVDHINGDTLDNRRSNLRICTASENVRNRAKRKDSKSRYKGVHWMKTNKGWCSQIRAQGKRLYLGCFPSAIEAAKAYNEAALRYHGEFARLNTFLLP